MGYYTKDGLDWSEILGVYDSLEKAQKNELEYKHQSYSPDDYFDSVLYEIKDKTVE